MDSNCRLFSFNNMCDILNGIDKSVIRSWVKQNEDKIPAEN